MSGMIPADPPRTSLAGHIDPTIDRRFVEGNRTRT
jgi:hypothetical protein